MGENNQEWSWVGEDGTEHDLDESELTFSLSSEELPVHILVTKRGWGEWLPAMQVAELQWALPAGRSDNPRKPQAGRRAKPPLDRYSALKKRAEGIASGQIDPASESSLAMPVVQLPPRPASSAQGLPIPQQPAPHQYRAFSIADTEEPTLQIDAAALGAALEAESLLQPALPPVAPRTILQGSPGQAAAGETPPQAARLGSKPDHSQPLPTLTPKELGSSPRTTSAFPPQVTQAGSQPPPAALNATGSHPAFQPVLSGSVPPPPAMTIEGRPALGSRPGASQFPPPNPFDESRASQVGRGSASGASSPSFAPVTPPREQATGKWLWITIAAGLLSAAGIAVWLGNRGEDPEITAPIQTPVAPPTKAPTPTACKTSVTALPVAGWLYPAVRPIIARAPGSNSLLVGYAQTSRMSAGLIVDTAQLNSQKPFTTQGNSPLLSVAPITQALGQQASFLESRAASTLQSAVFVSAKRPFALGLNREGLAIRREGESQDTVVWKPQWDTVTVPLTARVDEHTHAIVVRGGGERGNILVGRLNDDAEPQGALQEMVVDAPKLGTPSLSVASRRVLIAVDAATRDGTRKLYLASAEAPRVPAVSEVLPINDENMTNPGAIALRDGTTFVAYTRGPVGGQSVVARLLDKKRQLLGPALEISPAGKDAFGPELALDGDKVIVFFIVRQGNNNELWASSLECIPGDG